MRDRTRNRRRLSAGRGHTQAGQALVELALVIPLLLLLTFGVVAVGRMIQTQMGVSAVVREAARVGAAHLSARDGLERGQLVASGYGLSNGSLALTVGGDFRRGGQVVAQARYTVGFGDLPLLGWAAVPVSSTHSEPIDLYRSIW